jgi:hypothetical protein
MVSSFALLGAVVAGAVFGWGDHSAETVRAVGAAGGAIFGLLSSLKIVTTIVKR